MRKRFGLLGVIAALALAAAHPVKAAPTPGGPSFSCKTPSRLEAVICADPELSQRDRDLAALFADARTGLVGSAPSNELAEQRRWLADRDRFCAEDRRGPRTCLLGFYDDRMFDLAVATLFKDHDRAIGEIRRIVPRAAPLYEAIYRYATIDDQKRRQAAVEPLIAPAFADLRMIPAQTFQGRQLPAQPEHLLDEITNPAEVVGSDENFSTLLVVASTRNYRGAVPLPLPCTALVLRPGLWAAAEPHYGGAIDSWTPTTDCKATLPPAPRFEALVSAATNAQPFCQGTIRFSLGAAYGRRIAKLRLGLPDRTDPIFAKGHNAGADRFMKAHKAQAEAAINELGGVYALLPPDRSRLTPEAAIRVAVLGAFNLCE